MPEIGIPYVLTGPTGQRAVFGDPTDPDFIGYLDPENGITGLLDSADVRETYIDHSEADGGSQGDNFLSRKVGTLQGIVWPADQRTVNAAISKLFQASRALRGSSPAVLTWTPTGGQPRTMQVWRQSKVTITGRRPKQFVVPLASPDPYVYSSAIHNQIIVPNAGAGDAGFTNPMTNPITTAYQSSGQIVVSNVGDADTWPSFVITGPVSNPTLRNATTGLQWTLTYTLQAGEFLVVQAKPPRSVLLGGTANRYSAYAANFSSNTWWPLVSGANDIRFLPTAYSTGAQVTVFWQDAWEQ